jgi:shikimate kinase
LETKAIKETVGHALSVTPSQDKIIALGGGALLREENRSFAEGNGNIILLMAELKTLLERLNSESGNRPLLVGDLRGKLTSLLAKRSEHYNSFPLLIHVDGKTTKRIIAGSIETASCPDGWVYVIVGSVDRWHLLYERGLQNPVL